MSLSWHFPAWAELYFLMYSFSSSKYIFFLAFANFRTRKINNFKKKVSLTTSKLKIEKIYENPRKIRKKAQFFNFRADFFFQAEPSQAQASWKSFSLSFGSCQLGSDSYKLRESLEKFVNSNPANLFLEGISNLKPLWVVGRGKLQQPVRPRDTRPQAARTSQVHVFELGPKIFEMKEFRAVWVFSFPKKRASQGLTVGILHSRLKCLGGVPVLWSKWRLASSLLQAIKTCHQACPPGYLMHFS